MKAWSHSMLTAFETCAHQFYRVKVLKDVVEQQGEAALWGDRVHKALETRVRDKTPLPDWAAQWESLAAKFDPFGDRVACEVPVGITKNFKPVGFWDSDCWFRAKIDVVVYGRRTLDGDYKTGKIKDDFNQVALSAAALMHGDPGIDSVLGRYYWLAHGKSSTKEIRRDEVPAIWQEFIPRVARLEAAHDNDRWPKKPSGLCNGWCLVKDCEYWKPKRR